MQIKSPLTHSLNVKKRKEIKTEFLIEKYREMLGVDVKKYFTGLDSVSVYECLDSGYQFYYPFDITGDGKFYEALQKHRWYYMDWKWEHEEALALVKGAKSLLEIGCAQGEFLEKVAEKGTACAGIELNAHAAEVGRKKGLNILEESIQTHSQKNKDRYDVVCSFQVAEHIAPIGEFIQSSLDVLKPGGKFVMSVPNNDSLIFTANNDIVLNMPPHHMGLWNMNSLLSLSRFFPLRADGIYLEPLQSYHVNFANKIAEATYKEKLKRKHLSQIPFAETAPRRLINMSVRAVAPYIVGHSIMAVYTKT